MRGRPKGEHDRNSVKGEMMIRGREGERKNARGRSEKEQREGRKG